MIGRAEWLSPLYRLSIIADALAFGYAGRGALSVLVALAALDVFLLARSLQRRGPLSHGRSGIAFECAHSIIGPLVYVAALHPRSYLESTNALPLSTFGSALTWLIGIYPTNSFRRPNVRRLALMSVFGVWSATYVVHSLMNGYTLGELPWETILSEGVFAGMALFLGMMMSTFALEFAATVIDSREEDHIHFYDWIHSAVLGPMPGLSQALRSGLLDPIEAATELQEREVQLRAEYNNYRINQLPSRAPDIFAETIREFRPVLMFASTPAVAGISLEVDEAILVRQILRDLLSNVVRHSAPGAQPSVHLAADIANSVLTISSTDSGPGFPNGFRLDAGSNLGRLKRELERRGGQLVLPPPSSAVCTVRASLRLAAPSTMRHIGG